MEKRATASRTMIATGNPLAAMAAQSILSEGGSAVDAAIAADAVLGVVEPMATSIGGDLLAMLVHPDGKVQSYNGTGRSPTGLSVASVAALPGGRIPERHPYSVTTPGAVAGWRDLHERYGVLPWPRLFSAAIDCARSGFAVAPVAAREWALFDKVLHAHSTSATVFRAGASPKPGERFANPDLADTLALIASQGADAFYLGEIAQRAASAVQQAGGVLSKDDFARHQGFFCDPISQSFGAYQLHQCPPNTHGVAVLHALQDMENGVWQSLADQQVALVRATAAAMKHAQNTVADPAGNTVCTVIVDESGLAITLMSSVFKRFGSGISVPQGGFVLQNRGFGFSAPGAMNGAAPGKRPYHTVVPGAATKNGQFYLGMGVVGGLMQPQGQIQILMRHLRDGQPLAEALNAPRWRLEAGNTLAIEADMPADVSQALRDAGFSEPAAHVGELAGRSDFGGAQAVMRDAQGMLHGVSDWRKDGVALGS